MRDLSDLTIDELRYWLQYQTAKAVSTWGVGICGHNARGSRYCADCLRAEIDRRTPSPGAAGGVMGNFDESEVMDAATCRQALALLVDALGDFEGMDDPPQGFSPKLDRLRAAFRMGRDALRTPDTGDGHE